MESMSLSEMTLTGAERAVDTGFQCAAQGCVDTVGGDLHMDIHGDGVIEEQGLQRQAHHKDSRILPLRRELIVGVVLLGIIGVDDALAAEGQGVAGHLLHGYLRVGHAEDLCQLGLRDVVGQRPLRQERTHQRRTVRDGIPQGAVEPPGIEVGVVGINIEVGEKVGAAGLGAGKPAGGYRYMQLTGESARHIAGVRTHRVQNYWYRPGYWHCPVRDVC